MFKRIAMFMASLLIMGCVACVPPASVSARADGLNWWVGKQESLLITEPDLMPKQVPYALTAEAMEADQARRMAEIDANVEIFSHSALLYAFCKTPQVQPWINGGHKLVYQWRESDSPLLGRIDNYGNYQEGFSDSWTRTVTMFIRKDGVSYTWEQKRSLF